jgi:hypothetical protein
MTRAQPSGNWLLPPPLPPPPPPLTPATSYFPTPIPHALCASGRLMPSAIMKLGSALVLSLMLACTGCAHGAARCVAVPLGGTAAPQPAG